MEERVEKVDGKVEVVEVEEAAMIKRLECRYSVDKRRDVDWRALAYSREHPIVI